MISVKQTPTPFVRPQNVESACPQAALSGSTALAAGGTRASRLHKSPFQQRVYAALRKIPAGQVTTYKILAEHIKCSSCRAVGQALRRNPFAPKVPCHRVIASDLTSGGVQGCRAGTPIKKKLRLLAAEGVKFKNGRLVNPDLIYRFVYTPSTEKPRLFAARARRRS